MQTSALESAIDPRIGLLNSGRHYAFVNGYDQPETVGTRAEVERALGILTHGVEKQKTKSSESSQWNVTMLFEYPAWDEVDGIVYRGISATSKSDAARQVRKQAEIDGHACGGRGRYWFTAVRADG